MRKRSRPYGFTLVELLIVIVVIAILAVISIVAYNGVTARAAYSREQDDMQTIKKLILYYYADNGQYPSTGGTASWWGWGQSNPFVPGVVPTYANSMPQMPANSAVENSYLYTSNGTDYKLIRYSPPSGLPAIERTNNSLADPIRPVTGNDGAWGYWSSGAANW